MPNKKGSSNNRVLQRLMDLSISTKIMGYYLLLLIISISLSSILYQKVHMAIISGQLSDVSFQMLHSVSTSIDTTINTVADYSKSIVFDGQLQDSLRSTSKSYNFSYQRQADSALNRLVGGSSYASSIYIFDIYGNRYSAEKHNAGVLNINSIREASWYNEVMDKKGGYILSYNAGGIFKSPAPQENYISLIRVMNNMHTQMPMAILILNIPESVLKKSYQGIASNYNTEVFILDDKNNIIVNSENKEGFNVKSFVSGSTNFESAWSIWKSKNIEYMVSCIRVEKTGWKIMSIIPLRQLSKESGILGFIIFVVIAVNSLFLFVGSVVISRLITVPIKKLCNSMKDIEKGEFKKLDIKAGNDEIGRLRDGYNTMVDEIQNLISKIVEEQRMKRKTELDVLQAQIKPHFLYNTFDAISSLALSGKSRDVYNIMKALGTYYRTSLSKGKEIITIGEEIDVVRNYLKIQKYRYEDLFTVEYDIDDTVVDYKILKLVLQPFVENALYHGLRPKGSSGVIFVGTKHRSDYIELIISDDGVGMSNEDVDKLTSGKTVRDKDSFGIWGTIERLKIFYGVEDIISIESQLGGGTKVTIKIPLVSKGG